MKVGINISLTLNGIEQNVSYKEAKELHQKLSDLLERFDGIDSKEKNLAGLDSITGSLSALGVEDVAEFETDGPEVVLEENRDIQDAMIDELNNHEEAISAELEELKKRTKDMNNLIENYNK